MASIFLSHSSKDKPIVFRLNEDLEAGQRKVWADVNMPPGASIPREVASAG